QMDWAQLTHPDDLEGDLKNYERMLDGEIDNYTMDKRFIRKDGEIVYTTLSVSCVRDENGAIRNILASMLDITDRKQLQIQGRFQEMGGAGAEREIIGEPMADALYSVTTRTVSAGADLSIIWYMNKEFGNGPQEHLALLTLWSGIAGSLIITAFIAFFIQRNQTITRRVQEAIGELKKISEAVEQSPVSVVITDKNGTIEYVNPRFSEVTGYSADEAIGQNPKVLKSGNLPESFYKELWDTILAGKVWRGEFKNKRKN
ncbi:unnamed protein product, partial [marine sediment metagenome]